MGRGNRQIHMIMHSTNESTQIRSHYGQIEATKACDDVMIGVVAYSSVQNSLLDSVFKKPE